MTSIPGSNNIRVAVRVRPFLPFEAGSRSCIDVLPSSEAGLSSYNDANVLTRGTSVRIGGKHSSVQSSPGGGGGHSGHAFTFDTCFSGAATQSEIYQVCVFPLLEAAMEGYNATALAYGQTGAGKTYTTLGPSTSAAFFENKDGTNSAENETVGILPRALRDLFHHLDEKKRLIGLEDSTDEGGGGRGEVNGETNDKDDDEIREEEVVDADDANADDDASPSQNGASKDEPPSPAPPTSTTSPKYDYRIKLQFLELYGEEINDLLAPATSGKNKKDAPKIIIRDAGGDAEALGATEAVVESAHDAMVCLTKGMLRRVTGATAMNAESSRSHAIMSVLIEQVSTVAASEGGVATVVKKSKFNFVDLAGSERQKRTNAKGKRLREGININKGLLVLGNVISALASGGGDGTKFVPFRDSKLTRLLRGSLGGNHKTLMIACASPSHKNAEESLNCLRYANRAKNIQNRAVVNVDPHSRLVHSLREQVKVLAGELLRVSNGGVQVDEASFTNDVLLLLTKGGKEAQSFKFGKVGLVKSGAKLDAKSDSKPETDEADTDATTPALTTAATQHLEKDALDLTTELNQIRLSLKESQRNLFEKTEQLDAVVAERDNLRSMDEVGSTPARSHAQSAVTPSKAKGMGMGREESLREILTTLSIAEEEPTLMDTLLKIPEDDTEATSPVLSMNTPPSTPDQKQDHQSPQQQQASYAAMAAKAVSDEELTNARSKIQDLDNQLKAAQSALDRSTQELGAKSEDLEAAWSEVESLKDRLRHTPDIDEDTIHYMVKQIASYDEHRMDNFESEGDDDDESSMDDSISTNGGSERKEFNEGMSTFASAMFSTGKFLVDRELFQESIPCFEVVLEVRRELYGWDDPLVGDALHMEGFVRSKMGDYDRALMLLWDALRIRKIASEPLKISATLRLLADLHFSKEENMHAALFYEECARHLKEHDMKDPHLPLVLIDLARTKDRLGEYAESMNYFEEALVLYEQALDHDDDRIASLQYEMGVLAFQMGDRERGESCFRHFIRIRKSKGNSLDEGVANALFVLGSLHWATKKRDLANECWIEALDIFKGLGRTDDDPYVKSLKEKINRAQRRPMGRGGFIQRIMEKQ